MTPCAACNVPSPTNALAVRGCERCGATPWEALIVDVDAALADAYEAMLTRRTTW